MADALGIGDHANFDDLISPDCETKYPALLATWSEYDTDRSVHKRELCALSMPLEDVGDRCGTVDLARRAHSRSDTIEAECGVWVKRPQKRGQVAGA